MKKKKPVIFIMIVVVFSMALVQCEKKVEKSYSIQKENEIVNTNDMVNKFINYEVLKSVVSTNSEMMVILVSEKSTKQEVMELLRHLKSQHSLSKMVFIQIFDSKEAYQNQQNDSYPENKYWKHFLADYSHNPNTGHDELNWVAEGRDH
ncbi:MAG: hypothetical protein WC602_06210 [archaeon]